MSLIHPSILYGLGLALIPVILHLLLRRKPKKFFFPALQLLQQRQKQNVRRWRLRHIWLLLLRMLVILLIVLAVARPSVPAADYALQAVEWAVVLGVLFLAAAVYWGLLFYWKRKQVSKHDLAARKTYLRGSTGLVTFLLLLLLVGWPYQRRILAEIANPDQIVTENLPVAAVLVFDTSLSMQYRKNNLTRLEVAQKIASSHITTLPTRSRMAITDSSADSPILFQADRSGAQAKITALNVKAVSIPLNDRLRSAIRAQEQDLGRTLEESRVSSGTDGRDNVLREIYLFTDLAKTAWNESAARLLREEIERFPWLSIYLIDVGVEKPVNVGLSRLNLSGQLLSRGDQLLIETSLISQGIGAEEKTVEFLMQNQSGQLVKQGQSPVQLSDEAGARVQFGIPNLNGSLVQGEIRLASSDPFPADDVRYFTVEIQPPPKVVVSAPTRADAIYWLEALEALSPSLSNQPEENAAIQFVPYDELLDFDLNSTNLLTLINVSQPDAQVAEVLSNFVSRGGGLAVVLGSDGGNPPASAVAWNSEAFQKFLPGKLLGSLKLDPPQFFDLQNFAHPLLSKFETLGGAGELSSQEVRHFWRVEPHEISTVIAPFSDRRRSPALLDRPFGRGRTLLLTTSVDLKGWNDLPRSWQFLVLVDQIQRYLGQQFERVFTYQSGEVVVVDLPPEKMLERYLVRMPEGEQWPGEVPEGSNTLTFTREIGQLGNYEVLGREPADSGYRTGFSVNPDPAESDFSRLNSEELENLLGEKRFSVARKIEDLEANVGQGRLGIELFPNMVLLLIFIFCTEHLVANRFYHADQTSG